MYRGATYRGVKTERQIETKKEIMEKTERRAEGINENKWEK